MIPRAPRHRVRGGIAIGISHKFGYFAVLAGKPCQAILNIFGNSTSPSARGIFIYWRYMEYENIHPPSVWNRAFLWLLSVMGLRPKSQKETPRQGVHDTSKLKALTCISFWNAEGTIPAIVSRFPFRGTQDFSDGHLRFLREKQTLLVAGRQKLVQNDASSISNPTPLVPPAINIFI